VSPPGTGGDAAQQRGRALLVRHAETEWTLTGQHTGRTDIPLTEHGRATARALAPALAQETFALVLVSPSLRARETCELCGLGAEAQPREDLLEWNYGDYEGLTSAQIHEQRPDWDMWRDGCPGGEDAAQVATRADRVIAEIRAGGGIAAVFSHGHVLRVLGARWIALEGADGARLGLSPGARSLLGYEHGTSILARWSEPPPGS
jgi:broad specificity phosphatase PhoE